MHPIDWAVVAAYCVLATIIGVIFSRRASTSISEFFIAGRNLPWWIAGTSIVATTFAADTPLVVSGLVRTKGIAGNWLWWNVLLGNMLATFFYARLWRRAHIITDIELIELRYAGKPAAVLRGALALYRGVVLNCITIGWVTQAMVKISKEFLPFDKGTLIVVSFGLVLAYCVTSGYWGVVVTDFFQFIIGMGGCIVLAAIAVMNVGGITLLKEKLHAVPSFTEHTLAFVPQIGAGKLALFTFAVYIAVQWWATQGEGGGYIAQRLFSTKDERESVLASLWFTFAHYALRPWPWILVGLVSMIMFVDLPDAESAYPKMMMAVLPVGLRGLAVAGMLAAFMSTMDTHLNWGASYVVNDLYRRFMVKDASERHYVLISRIASVVIAIVGGAVAYFTESIVNAWTFMFTLTCGVGLVLLLRWYWWRINAWSEISALITSTVVATILQLSKELGAPELFAVRLVITLSISTIVWVTVTFVTSPVPEEHLKNFYSRVRPGRALWKPIADRLPQVHGENRGLTDLGCWLGGVISVYSAMFGIGKLVLGEHDKGIAFLIVSGITMALILRVILRSESSEQSSS